jgi:hypothetical protein
MSVYLHIDKNAYQLLKQLLQYVILILKINSYRFMDKQQLQKKLLKNPSPRQIKSELLRML